MDEVRKRRVDTGFAAWRAANPNKPKVGNRAQVMSGERYCTAGMCTREDFFVDADGKIKSIAMSKAVQQRWEDDLLNRRQRGQ